MCEAVLVWVLFVTSPHTTMDSKEISVYADEQSCLTAKKVLTPETWRDLPPLSCVKLNKCKNISTGSN